MSSPREMQGGGQGESRVPHVVDEVADYLAGRCAPERADDIRTHLRACPTCAADYAWAAAFRAGGKPDAAHLAPDRIAELSAARATTAPHEQAHLVACGTCARELSLLRSVASPPELAAAALPGSDVPISGAARRPAAAEKSMEVPPAERHSRRGTRGTPAAVRRPVWRWAPAVFAAAAVVLLLLRPWHARDVAALRALAQLEALPVELDRGAAPEAGFAELRLRGLEAYQGGDYASAGALLAEADRLRPGDPEVLLYLGSSALLRGEAHDAVEVLERAARAAEPQPGSGPGAPPELQVEIRWQLVQAHLSRGERAAAEQELRQLAAWQGPRAAAVDALLARLNAPQR